MRLIKMFGLAALAATAFVGPTSASAASTQLCNTHTALTCSEAATSVGMSNLGTGPGFLLSDLVEVLCLTISGSGTPLGLANPQQIHIGILSFTNCGTTSAHSNCEVNVLELPLSNLNKTGLDTGTLTATNGEMLVDCQNIDIFGTDILCIFDAAGLEFSVGAQHLTANEVPIEEIVGLCPEESFLDMLLATIGNRYVLA